jgi:hypothetical protein
MFWQISSRGTKIDDDWWTVKQLTNDSRQKYKECNSKSLFFYVALC